MDKGIGTENSRKNPYESSNFLSKLSFAWIFKLFMVSYKKTLEESDLYDCLKTQRSQLLGETLQKHWQIEYNKWKESKCGKRPKLIKCLLKMFKTKLVITGILNVISRLCFEIVGPIIFANFLNYFSPSKHVSWPDACYWAAALCINMFLHVLITHHLAHLLICTGIEMNIACSSLIYRKVLMLSPTCMDDSSGGTSTGQVLNLLSNDVSRFDYGLMDVHDLWVGPFQMAITAYIIYQYVNWTGLTGIGVSILFLPLLAVIGKKSSVAIPKAAGKTDNRLRFMNEILKGIQIIKMYAWEKPFAAIIEKSRIKEMKAVKRVNCLYHLCFSFEAYMAQVCVFISIVTYVYLENEISGDKVYIMVEYYSILSFLFFSSFTIGLHEVIGAKTSLKRIENFLILDEVTKKHQGEYNNIPVVKDVVICCNNITAKWNPSSDKETLKDIDLTITSGKMVGIIGQVGAGKTSFLRTLIGEVPICNGTMTVHGKIAYASQEPWIYSATVKENILFDRPLNNERYEKVLSVCQLHEDLLLLPFGDKTIVGESGINLSGGQRARINLARAVYSDADVYMLDDPLSAVDVEVGKRIFHECLLTYLQGKTVILITHHTTHMKYMDHIVLLNDGQILFQGKFDDLQSANTQLTNYLKDSENLDISEDYVQDKREYLSETKDNEDDNKEIIAQGRVPSKIYVEFFKAAKSPWLIVSIIALFFMYKTAAFGADYLIAYWVNVAETNQTKTNVDEQKEWYIVMFGGIIIVEIMSYMILIYAFYELYARISRNLHANMFENVIRATMPFFYKNPVGRIMNRFSKDINTVDLNMPLDMYDVCNMGLGFLFSITMISGINPYLLPFTVILTIIIYLLREFYIKTSRSLRRIAGAARSPIYDHLTSTFHGISTIRAFNAQDKSLVKFNRNKDNHTSSLYLFISSSRAFGLLVDVILNIFLTAVVLVFLFVGDNALIGNVGLALSKVLWLCRVLQWAIRVTTKLENEFVSVERILEYTKLKKEPPFESSPDKKPPPDWPSKGDIVFKDMSIKYDEDGETVLKDLNFRVAPKEKIGIVGRTGAGKTSLITALFRLVYMEGEIYIDDVPISSLGIHDLRSKISIIPQEPILFEGTLRGNLDPFEEYKDDELWQVLEDVKLKTFVKELAAGLDTKVSESGTNYSVGQRQLLCLARTILKKNRIIVLDEATANVDSLTDENIQQTFREKFQDCTVLTIAHRLNTIMDSDRVLVMDSGSVVEFDHPFVLLQREDGFFYNLVHQSGPEMEKTLTNIAKRNYKNADCTDALKN